MPKLVIGKQSPFIGHGTAIGLPQVTLMLSLSLSEAHHNDKLKHIGHLVDAFL
jgi:hypothetical protein